MSPLLRVVLPIIVLVLAAAGTAALVLSKQPPPSREPQVVVPIVRTRVVQVEDVGLTVTTQGTVSPRTESLLVTEVSGRILAVAPSFASGGFFDEGETLLQIDPLDYEIALVRSKAEVRRAELNVALQEAEAEIAREEWQDLAAGVAGPLNLREPQLAEARALLDSARAGLAAAERDLARTEIRAPYAGRVRDKRVDVGQYVTRGAALGTIYAVDYAEIRLPLPDADLAFIDLPLAYRDQGNAFRGPAVTLRADFAGRPCEWHGRIVRTEGEIDPRSRMVHAIAQVDDPYRRRSGQPPLAVGLFVEAEIAGRTVQGAVVIPRAALRDGNVVLVVDADNRLRPRTVEVLRTSGAEVVVSAGLADGERICVSTLTAFTNGMQVRPVADESNRREVS